MERKHSRRDQEREIPLPEIQRELFEITLTTLQRHGILSEEPMTVGLHDPNGNLIGMPVVRYTSPVAVGENKYTIVSLPTQDATSLEDATLAVAGQRPDDPFFTIDCVSRKIIDKDGPKILHLYPELEAQLNNQKITREDYTSEENNRQRETHTVVSAIASQLSTQPGTDIARQHTHWTHPDNPISVSQPQIPLLDITLDPVVPTSHGLAEKTMLVPVTKEEAKIIAVQRANHGGEPIIEIQDSNGQWHIGIAEKQNLRGAVHLAVGEHLQKKYPTERSRAPWIAGWVLSGAIALTGAVATAGHAVTSGAELFTRALSSGPNTTTFTDNMFDDTKPNWDPRHYWNLNNALEETGKEMTGKIDETLAQGKKRVEELAILLGLTTVAGSVCFGTRKKAFGPKSTAYSDTVMQTLQTNIGEIFSDRGARIALRDGVTLPLYPAVPPPAVRNQHLEGRKP